MCDKIFFKVQICSDLISWKDVDMVFSTLPDAEAFASDLSMRSFWTSSRVIRVEESVCNEYYSHTHRHILDFK